LGWTTPFTQNSFAGLFCAGFSLAPVFPGNAFFINDGISLPHPGSHLLEHALAPVAATSIVSGPCVHPPTSFAGSQSCFLRPFVLPGTTASPIVPPNGMGVANFYSHSRVLCLGNHSYLPYPDPPLPPLESCRPTPQLHLDAFDCPQSNFGGIPILLPPSSFSLPSLFFPPFHDGPELFRRAFDPVGAEPCFSIRLPPVVVESYPSARMWRA